MSFLNSFEFVFEPLVIIKTLGALGVFAIIFLETGAFFGFFLPGDSLLFTAGFLASKGYVSLPVLLIGSFIAAVIGDSVGYAFGRKIGPALFAREDSRFFNKKHVEKAHDFYVKYGKKTIIIARFMPIIRTFAPIVAGVANMEYKTFLTFNVIGGFAWTFLMLIAGYALGSTVPDPDKYILPIILVIIVVSAVPAIREILRRRS